MGLQVISGGVTYDMDNGTTFDWMDYDGFAVPEVRSTLESFAQQDGANWIGYRLSPRKILLKFIMLGTSLTELFTRRQELMTIFRPTNTAYKLKYTLPDTTVRQIDFYPAGGMLLPAREMRLGRNDAKQVTVVELICPDPLWYDPVQVLVTASLPAQTNLVFPITFPITFGSSVISFTQNIVYVGTWSEYPVITITGPFARPVIENISTNEMIELDYVIPGGRIVTINLKPGSKTVTDDLGTNLIGTVTSDSDFSSFHIAPAPEVSGGTNQIHIEGSGAAVSTSIVFSYYKRYFGI